MKIDPIFQKLCCSCFGSMVESFNGCAPSMVIHLNGFFCQVISRVGDLVGIKYFPAQPKEQQREEKTSKLD